MRSSLLVDIFTFLGYATFLHSAQPHLTLCVNLYQILVVFLVSNFKLTYQHLPLWIIVIYLYPTYPNFNMSKIDWRNFRDLTASCREKTLSSKSRTAFFNFDHQNKTITDLGLDKLRPSLEFFLMDGEHFDLASIRQQGNKSRSANIDKNYSANNDLDDQSLTRVILNWQNLIIRQLVEKLDDFGPALSQREVVNQAN